jgi:hypothetical protein
VEESSLSDVGEKERVGRGLDRILDLNWRGLRVTMMILETDRM